MKPVTPVSQCSNSNALRRSLYVDHFARLEASGLFAKWRLTFANEHRRFLHALVGTTGDALVVTAEDAVLGYLIFEERSTISGRSATIIALRVIPQYRGLGYGRELLAELMILARRAGWERISVDVGVGATRAMDLGTAPSSVDT